MQWSYCSAAPGLLPLRPLGMNPQQRQVTSFLSLRTSCHIPPTDFLLSKTSIFTWIHTEASKSKNPRSHQRVFLFQCQAPSHCASSPTNFFSSSSSLLYIINMPFQLEPQVSNAKKASAFLQLDSKVKFTYLGCEEEHCPLGSWTRSEDYKSGKTWGGLGPTEVQTAPPVYRHWWLNVLDMFAHVQIIQLKSSPKWSTYQFFLKKIVDSLMFLVFKTVSFAEFLCSTVFKGKKEAWYEKKDSSLTFFPEPFVTLH